MQQLHNAGHTIPIAKAGDHREQQAAQSRKGHQNTTRHTRGASSREHLPIKATAIKAAPAAPSQANSSQNPRAGKSRPRVAHKANLQELASSPLGCSFPPDSLRNVVVSSQPSFSSSFLCDVHPREHSVGKSPVAPIIIGRGREGREIVASPFLQSSASFSLGKSHPPLLSLVPLSHFSHKASDVSITGLLWGGAPWVVTDNDATRGSQQTGGTSRQAFFPRARAIVAFWGKLVLLHLGIWRPFHWLSS